MARGRFDELPRERKDAILRLAAAEFARAGFQGTSYNRLLERLKLGKSSAYYYFDDKRDLFLTAVEHCYARYFESLRNLPRPTSPGGYWEFVRKASLLGFEFMIEDPTAAALMACVQRERSLEDELKSSDLLSSMNGFYEAVVTDGQRLVAVRKDVPQRLLVSTVRNLAVTFDQWFIEERASSARCASPARAADLFVEALRRLLEERPTRSWA